MDKLNIDNRAIHSYCAKHRIRRLALFGSVLTEDFSPESDVDVLVEFEPDAVVGLLRMAAMERELSAILGRKADLRTPDDLSPYFRDEVVSLARVQYAEG